MPVLRARVLTPVGPDEVRYWQDGVVVIDGDLVVEVGAYDGLPVDEDLRPGLLTPGFVDAHVHFPQTRIVGQAAGPLLEWLEHAVFPEEARFADPDYAAAVADEFCANLARAGTTLAMIYGSVHAQACDRLLAALDARGLRAIAGPVLMDEGAPPALLRSPARALEALAELEVRWRGHARLQVAAIPRFALSCSATLMREAAILAQERGMWVSTHVAENREECRLACERFAAQDYLEIYERLGLIHARTVLAHCIHFSSDEWDRLAAAGAVVAHCPDSNAFLGSGSMPTAEVLRRDLPLAIGSDVAAGRSLRITAGLAHAYDNGLRVGVRLDPRRLLWWGTRGGALALGHDRVGMLAPGMVADMVLHPLAEHVVGEAATLAALIFDGDRGPALRTWVGGRLVHGDPSP